MTVAEERRHGSRTRIGVGHASKSSLNGNGNGKAPESKLPVPVVEDSESFLRQRRMTWKAFALLAVLLVAYIISVLVRGSARWLWLDGWTLSGFELVASGLCIYKGFAQRATRTVPLILGFALLSWTIGDFVLTAESVGGANPPTPSPADVFYLLFYPLAYVATVLLLQKGLGRLARPNWLDGVVAGLGAAALCGAFAFHSIEHAVGLNALGTAVNLAYPIGDLLLLLLVIGGTVLLSGRGSSQWYLLGVGLSVIVIGDTFNLFQSSSGLASDLAVTSTRSPGPPPSFSCRSPCGCHRSNRTPCAPSVSRASFCRASPRRPGSSSSSLGRCAPSTASRCGWRSPRCWPLAYDSRSLLAAFEY